MGTWVVRVNVERGRKVKCWDDHQLRLLHCSRSASTVLKGMQAAKGVGGVVRVCVARGGGGPHFCRPCLLHCGRNAGTVLEGVQCRPRTRE